MIVTLFLVLSVPILLLFFLNQLRIAQISLNHLFSWLKWYGLCLIVYYVLSSNQYYFDKVNYLMVDVVNLSVLIIISFGMIIYVHQYCIDKERENKMKELAIAYALLQKEEQERENDSLKKEEDYYFMRDD